MLMGHSDGTAQVRDAATMQPLGPPLRHEYAILSVAISPDSSLLVTGCVDRDRACLVGPARASR